MNGLKHLLIDTNIFLEILLEQERVKECKEVLEKFTNLYISDFSLYSIGIKLLNEHKTDVWISFLDDISINIKILSLRVKELKQLFNFANKFGLDFDDTYQYLIAKNNNLTIISFDSDFDKTDIKKFEPKDIIKKLRK